jgi:hypothetical protein
MRKFLGCLLGGAALVATPTFAHHSAVMFDDGKEITVSGTVKEFQYTNPHSWLLVDVKNDDGTVTTWGFVFGAHHEDYVTWFVSEGAARYRLPPELTAPLKEIPRDSSRALLPPLALRILELRKDVRQAFPEPFGKDALGLLTWLLTYGAKECAIDAASRRALRLEFERQVEQLRSPLQRWRSRAKLALLSRSAGRQS